MKHQWMTAIFCLVCPLSSMAAITTVMPTALTGPLTNPGMGVASFHQGEPPRVSWRVFYL